jgi:hypothetical protein
MKLVFEGTEEQLENLKALAKNSKENLPEHNDNYQVNNLWHVNDVKINYVCEDEDAMDVLESALHNEATMAQIRFAIHLEADYLGLKKKNNIMEDLEAGTKVCLTADARDYTYEDMDWKNDRLVICHAQKDGEGMGKIYSFYSLEDSNKEITCSLYGYELELI